MRWHLRCAIFEVPLHDIFWMSMQQVINILLYDILQMSMQQITIYRLLNYFKLHRNYLISLQIL